ncbi:MAG: polysaccharide biosynthesis/export family protein [Chitinophagales bacterium]|nr:polysaccharide biosynthesis/export family protein [Chitinophagales bacterium]
MLRDTKDFYYFELKEVEYQKQVILPDDEIAFKIYTQDGFNLVDVIADKSTGIAGGETSYLVKDDGYLELPLLGEVYVKGMTRLEFEKFLEKKYSVWYNEPFIQLKVTNHRAYFFMGVGSASVVSLPYENTKLIEVLASIGGISNDSKSHKIKIIRGDYDKPTIKRIDLSTIAGLKDADFVILPNDLIIVDPRLRPAQAAISELGYLFTIISTITTLYLLVLSITKQ